MEIGDDPVTFRLANNGAFHARVVVWFVGLGALAFGGIAVKAAVSLVVNQPRPGEGGRDSTLAFLAVFAAFAYLFAEYAWCGRSTVLVACRHPGTVTIEADILRIEAPGVVSRPVEIHRSWVERAERFEGYDASATTFNSGPVRKTCVLRLRLPIGIPQALTPPELPTGYQLVRLPDCTVAVDAISLDFVDLAAAMAAINRWASQDAKTEPGDPPGVGQKNHRARNRRVVVWQSPFR